MNNNSLLHAAKIRLAKLICAQLTKENDLSPLRRRPSFHELSDMQAKTDLALELYKKHGGTVLDTLLVVPAGDHDGESLKSVLTQRVAQATPAEAFSVGIWPNKADLRLIVAVDRRFADNAFDAVATVVPSASIEFIPLTDKGAWSVPGLSSLEEVQVFLSENQRARKMAHSMSVA